MVFDKVRDMIASQLQVDAAEIKAESRLVEDLKADSANIMVMILELESEFGIEVEDEVILNLKTVGDVANYIEKHQ
ncbi:MAG: acyl carrier protein [Clostridiales bacterium]|nr:acyl carrier protein [Clostridiales bacterium]